MANVNTITVGTAHFISKAAAYRYYGGQGFSRFDVDNKLSEGEIFVGRPLINHGERVLIDRSEGRFFVESPLKK